MGNPHKLAQTRASRPS